MDQIAQPLNIELLQAFPLPRNLEILPPQVLHEFARLYELVKGYVKLVDSYHQLEAQLRDIIQAQIATINKVIALLDDYHANSDAIGANIKKMEALYQEFTNYETYQYQLMSSNFNQNFLKLRFAKLVTASDEASVSLVKDYKNSSEDRQLSTFLQEFRLARKNYHLLKEKQNRWDEERISGLI